MQISAIQNHQLTNSSGNLESKRTSNSMQITKDLGTDSFSREKINNNISFKGGAGIILGGLVGIGAAIAIVATGGLAAPVIAGALATEVGCIAVGSKLDGD